MSSIIGHRITAIWCGWVELGSIRICWRQSTEQITHMAKLQAYNCMVLWKFPYRNPLPLLQNRIYWKARSQSVLSKQGGHQSFYTHSANSQQCWRNQTEDSIFRFNRGTHYHTPPPRREHIKRWCCLSLWCLSDVCLSVAYIGSKSRTERPMKIVSKSRVTWASYRKPTSHVIRTPFSRSKGQRSRSQGRGHIVAAFRTACYYYVKLGSPVLTVKKKNSHERASVL